MNAPLPHWLESMLSNPPHSGEGVHLWLFKAARQLHHHLPVNQIAGILAQAVQGCGRRVTDREIRDAVSRSIACAWQPSARGTSGTATASSARWRPVNPKLIERVITDGPTLADLWELSPIRVDSSEPKTEDFIDQLFGPDDLLCCATELHNAQTRPRSEWRRSLAQQSFIVPSAMSKLNGLTQDGKESARCLDNTGPRRYIVVEFDQGSLDGHAALAHHLSAYAPLVMAVHSGGKSLHSWFNASRGTEQQVTEFFDYAVGLGCDAATFTPCQLVRMPDGRRSDGKWQAVYYFDPSKLTPRESAL